MYRLLKACKFSWWRCPLLCIIVSEKCRRCACTLACTEIFVLYPTNKDMKVLELQYISAKSKLQMISNLVKSLVKEFVANSWPSFFKIMNIRQNQPSFVLTSTFQHKKLKKVISTEVPGIRKDYRPMFLPNFLSKKGINIFLVHQRRSMGI